MKQLELGKEWSNVCYRLLQLGKTKISILEENQFKRDLTYIIEVLEDYGQDIMVSLLQQYYTYCFDEEFEEVEKKVKPLQKLTVPLTYYLNYKRSPPDLFITEDEMEKDWLEGVAELQINLLDYSKWKEKLKC